MSVSAPWRATCWAFLRVFFQSYIISLYYKKYYAGAGGACVCGLTTKFTYIASRNDDDELMIMTYALTARPYINKFDTYMYFNLFLFEGTLTVA